MGKTGRGDPNRHQNSGVVTMGWLLRLIVTGSPLVGLSRTAIFSVFAGYFSETFEVRPALLGSSLAGSDRATFEK